MIDCKPCPLNSFDDDWGEFTCGLGCDVNSDNHCHDCKLIEIKLTTGITFVPVVYKKGYLSIIDELNSAEAVASADAGPEFVKAVSDIMAQWDGALVGGVDFHSYWALKRISDVIAAHDKSAYEKANLLTDIIVSEQKFEEKD